jgi:hypothetical protein
MMSGMKLIPIIAACHAIVGFMAYRARTLTDDSLWQSDVVIFLLPYLLAAIAIAAVTFRNLPRHESQRTRVSYRLRYRPCSVARDVLRLYRSGFKPIRIVNFELDKLAHSPLAVVHA